MTPRDYILTNMDILVVDAIRGDPACPWVCVPGAAVAERSEMARAWNRAVTEKDKRKKEKQR